MDTTFVSFPNLGIGELEFSKIVFSFDLFGKTLEVRWYGLIITVGIILAVLYACLRGKKSEGLISDDIVDVALWAVILGVIGARAYYVLTDSGNTYETFYDYIAVWNGGLAIYGGILGGLLGIFICAKIKKKSFFKILDVVTPGVVLAQAIGRWGNFFNGEAFGYEIAETSRFYFFNRLYSVKTGDGTLFNTLKMGLGNAFGEWTYYHPTFLYESCWNIVGFLVLNLFYRHKKKDGQIAFLYFAWYGFGRMFIEGLRTDSLFIPGTNLRISQCLGLFFFVFGLAMFFIFGALGKKAARVVNFAEGESTLGLSEKDADTADSSNANNNAPETEDPSFGKAMDDVLREEKQ